MEPSEAMETCERICDLIDEDVPEWAHAKAPDFFESVREKVAAISETIGRTGRVSDAQAAALGNIEEGVRKWIR